VHKKIVQVQLLDLFSTSRLFFFKPGIFVCFSGNFHQALNVLGFPPFFEKSGWEVSEFPRLFLVEVKIIIQVWKLTIFLNVKSQKTHPCIFLFTYIYLMLTDFHGTKNCFNFHFMDVSKNRDVSPKMDGLYHEKPY